METILLVTVAIWLWLAFVLFVMRDCFDEWGQKVIRCTLNSVLLTLTLIVVRFSSRVVGKLLGVAIFRDWVTRL